MSTHNLRKRFVKDHSLPISIFKNPYFNYYINLYQDSFYSLDNYNSFSIMIDKIGEDKFFEKSNNLKENIVKAITSKNSYKNFLNQNIKSFKDQSLDIKNNCSLYQNENHKKLFISIDLVSANLQALHFINPEIVFHKDNWKDLILEFSNEEYWMSSKKNSPSYFWTFKSQKTTDCSKVYY